jgi:hypothetical protein
MIPISVGNYRDDLRNGVGPSRTLGLTLLAKMKQQRAVQAVF